MSLLYQSKSTCLAPSTYIILQKPSIPTAAQSIRVSNSSISILDNNGKIIRQVYSDAKPLPLNLSNQQINQRSLINNIDDFIKGMNLSVFYIGATNSGKERLFDGNKHENALIYYFVNYALPMFKKKYRKLEIRMKMVLSIKQKMYDCLSQNRYSIIKPQQSAWQGITLSNATNVIIQNSQDFLNQIQRGNKQKNKLVLEYKQLYMTYITLQFIHQSLQNQNKTIISKLNVFQIPGVQILGDSHSNAKIKQSSSSIKSLLNFTALLQQYSKNQDFIPYSQNSILSLLTKDIICSNSLITTYFTFRLDDTNGSLATLKFIKPFNSLRQYPIINQSNSYGLIRKYRAEAYRKNNTNTDGEKQYVENQVIRLQTEQDYQRIMEKYTDLKQKYNQALKAKSQAQLQLIKCEEEKIQIGKALVQVQIQNTKLLEKLQNKDYQNGKKMLNVQNKLAQKQLSSQQLLQKLQLANQSLNQALQTKRDLQVQFIALKRNFIINKKQIDKLKQDNQNLALDVINITNLNEKLKQEILMAQNSNLQNNKSGFNNRRSVVIQMEQQKVQELKRQNKQAQQTIEYLKSQVQRFKKQLIQTQLNQQFKGSNMMNRSNVGQGSNGKDYQRIQLQSQNMQLINRLKLKQRKLDQIQQKLSFYQDQHQNLQNQLRQLKITNNTQVQSYRKKLQQILKNTNYQSIVKQMKQNFIKKDTQSLDKINSMKRDIQQSKRQKAQLRQYIRQLRSLLQEWAPKGAEIPEIKKFMNMNLNEESGDIEALRIKNRRLEQQIRRIKENNHSSAEFKESRVKQQYNYLKNSMIGNNSNINNNNNNMIDKLKAQNNSLLQQNRRLTILIKDGNKMDLNIIKKQNQTLKKQLSQIKSHQFQKTSISPSTINNDQKIIFYEKHIKKIQKQRSQLLSRCVVAEEQIKNLLAKVSAGKR